ncbi:MAG TPA: hemerythrin family protein [Anaeromyxobacteraceae bacterium]|nr:hemerythrin family protein [Anaeromyxobacteraceae bacterium]
MGRKGLPDAWHVAMVKGGPCLEGPVTETTAWSDTYRLGIPGVDQEHRTFFELIAAIEAGAAAGGVAPALEALRSLRRYAESHFANEEEFLEAVGFPELAPHRAEHEAFLRDVRALEQVEDLPAEVAVRMARAWIGQHILGTDRRYTRWLDEAEPEAPVRYPVTA